MHCNAPKNSGKVEPTFRTTKCSNRRRSQETGDRRQNLRRKS
ncbi:MULTISPECIES: hypothetical protein [Okeania]|nr:MULTISPECIES: hypothetical protein [Okeania]